jgi:hypothetical protein
MERSEPTLVDVILTFSQFDPGGKHISVDETITLLSGCKRLRCLHLTGEHDPVCTVLDVLRTTTPIRTLSLHLSECDVPIILPNDLCGGQAPIRKISFATDSNIVAPHWIMHGINPLHILSTDCTL